MAVVGLAFPITAFAYSKPGPASLCRPTIEFAFSLRSFVVSLKVKTSKGEVVLELVVEEMESLFIVSSLKMSHSTP